MAVQNFVIELIEELLGDKELGLTEQDIRFYDKGTTAETDVTLDDHIKWRNARYFNEDSNIIRSSILIIQLPFENGTEYINFHVGELYRIYRKDGMKGVLPIVRGDIKGLRSSAGQTLTLLNQFGDYEAIRNTRLSVRSTMTTTTRCWQRRFTGAPAISRWFCISAWAPRPTARGETSSPPWSAGPCSRSGMWTSRRPSTMPWRTPCVSNLLCSATSQWVSAVGV